MRWAILAERDAIVGEHMHHVQSHQCGQPDRRAHVIGEDKKRRAVCNEASVRGQAIDDRAHRVFAHTEMQIASAMAPAAAIRSLGIFVRIRRRIEIAEVFQRGFGRGIQIRRAAAQRRQLRRNRIHHLAGGDACGHAFGIRGKHRNVRIPTGWQIAVQTAIQLHCQIGKGLCVSRHARVPRCLIMRAAIDRLAEMRERLSGNQERRFGRPAEIFLG